MLIKLNGNKPELADNVFTAPGSKIIGKVFINSNSSIWYNTVIRGDIDRITIGKNTNIQENSSLHIDIDIPLKIGDNVTVGHGAILHGCTINNNCLIGMGAKILNQAVINKNCIIGAGALVTEQQEIPPKSLVLGVPGKVVRKLKDKEIEKIKKSAEHYCKLAQEHQD